MLKGLAWAGVAILCWTPLFSVGKRTLPVLDPFALATVRYGIGVVLLIALLAAVEGRAALRYGDRLGPAVLFGLVGIAGFNLLVWIGLMYTLPEHASIILALQTPMTAIAVWLAWGQRPAAFTVGCVAAALAGVLLVVTKGDLARAAAELAQGGALFGDVLVLLGGVAWMTYTMAAARFSGWSPLRYTVLTCVPGFFGLLAAHAVAIAIGVAVIPSAGQLASLGWQIAYLSVCTVALGVLAFNAAARRLGPLNTMLAMNLIPLGVFAIEAALGRSFAAIEIAGATAVIAALVANNLYLRGRSTRR